MEEIFRLRYNVYCEEMEFLDRRDYPDGLETDEFDERSHHHAVFGDDGLPVGYMRTVDAATLTGFPLFSHGLRPYSDSDMPAPGDAVEASRMMVRPDYRRIRDRLEDVFPSDRFLPNPPLKNASTLIQVKLLRLAYREAIDDGTRWFLAAMEPPFARRLDMIGFPFRQIGPAGDYHGTVIPYAMDLRAMERVMDAHFPQTWAFFDNPAADPHARTVKPGEWSLAGNQTTHHGGNSYAH